MIYPYRCLQCNHEFEVIKPVAHLNDQELCPGCGANKVERYISTTHFYGAGDWDKAEYNPAFGKVIKNSKHRAQEAKARGWLEVGNEDYDKTVASQDKKAHDIVEESTKDAYDALEHGIKTEYLAKR